MSPIFLSLFLNDVKMQLADIGNESITLERPSIYLLLLLELNSKRGEKTNVFVCVEVLRPSQQFFSHVGTEPPLPG